MKKTLAVDLTFEQKERLWHGVRMVSQGAFFQAHECFEQVFQQTQGEVRTLFRGLTQLSASYYQLCLGRGRAARSTLHKAMRNLELVECLSDSFRQRVEALFLALGAGPECARFLEVRPSDLTGWPVPDRLPNPP